MKIGCGPGEKGNWVVRHVRRIFGRGGEEGAALLEFAITLPILMTVLTGTVSFSLGLYVLEQVGNAASASAQTVGAEAGTVADPCAEIAGQITAMLPNLSASKITYWVSVTNSSGTTSYGPFNPPSTGTCIAAGSGGATSTQEEANYPVSVTVQYRYGWFPVLNFSPTSSLTSTETTMAE